jgi:hypothetical protein
MNVRMVKILIYLAALAVMGWGIRACSSEAPTVEPTAVAVLPPTTTPEPPLPTPVPPTETPVPPSPTPAPPTDTPSPTDTLVPASPTPVPPKDTPTPEAEVSVGSENCVACHTSQETLQALAVDKTVTSEATSGEG